MPEAASQSKSKQFFGFLGKKLKHASSPSSAILVGSSQALPLAVSPVSSAPQIPFATLLVQTVCDDPSTDDSKRVDRVPLPPLLTHPSTNPAVLKVQEELQKTTEQLEAELAKYANKFSEYAPLQDDDVKFAMSSSGEDGTGFGRMIEQVLSDQKIKNKTVAGKVGTFMGQVWPVAGIVLGIVSFSADAAGLLPLKITVNAVNAVVSAASKEHARFEDLLTSLPDLKKYDPFFSNLQKLGYDRVSDGLLETATKLFVAVTVFLRVSLEFLDTNRIVGAAKALKADKLADAKSGLSSAVADLDAAVNQEVLFDEKTRAWREECEGAMHFLSDLPVLKAHDDVRNLRVKDSGNWILQHETFLKWMSGEVKTIWCPGKPGAGKTFLCSTIIDHCRSYYRSTSDRQQTIGVAWIYCSYTNQNAQTIGKIIASLAKQLVASPCREVGQELMKEVKKFQEDHKAGSPSLNNYLDLLSRVVGALDLSVVVIDALDECAEVDSNGCNRELLIKKLLKLGVQLLVTSRDLPIIKALFNGSPRFGNIHILPDLRDIESYIHWKIYDEAYGSPKLRDLIQKHPSLLTDITIVVKEKYSQIFNLARLQMEQISKLNTYGRVKSALGVLPMKEGDFYAESIKRIKANEHHADQALRILAWILRAKTPMIVQDMRYAAAVVPGTYSMNFEEFALSEEDLVDCCDGLVIILPGSGTVGLAHPTVNDYLETARGQIFPTDPGVVVASSCITYLASDYMNTHRGPWRAPFFEYAKTTWLEYTRGSCEKEVLDLIIELFKRNLKIVVSKRPDVYTYMVNNGENDANDSLTLHTDGIWIACHQGLVNTVRRLLDMGAISSKIGDLKRDAFGLEFQEPLLIAVQGGFPAVTQVLVEGGVDPNTRDSGIYGRKGFTALHLAIRLYSIEREASTSRQIVEFLVGAGANIEARDAQERTPLHIAAWLGILEIIDFLLKKGAKVDVKDGEGNTPLHSLVQGNYSSAVALLLNWGADSNAKNKLGQSVLHTAVRCMDRDEPDVPVGITALLVERGAKMEARDNAGRTPLNLATKSSAIRGIRYLVKIGADLEAADNLGRTPLHISVPDSRTGVVEFLLEMGANVTAKDKLGHKPLDLAWTARKEVIDRGLVVDDELRFIEWVQAEAELNYKVERLDRIIGLLTNASAKALVVQGTGENSHNALGSVT